MELMLNIKKQVEEDLINYLNRSGLRKDIVEVLKEYVTRDGKRIRPIILILTSMMVDKKNVEKFRKASIALELFHNFTLIHDDIEDRSYYRRGKPTLHVLYGEALAINFGDALFNLVWKSILESGLTKEEILVINETFREVVEGQHIELMLVRNEDFDISYDTYFELASKKTGSLIALSFAFPFYKKDKKVFSEIYKKVKNLGLAFQIIDDVLNLTGDFEKYKKKIGDDITEGKRTLLVIHAIKCLPKEKAERLKAILRKHTTNEEEIKEAIELIKESGAVEYAKKKAQELIKENIDIFDKYFPESIEKEELMKIVNMFINRES